MLAYTFSCTGTLMIHQTQYLMLMPLDYQQTMDKLVCGCLADMDVSKCSFCVILKIFKSIRKVYTFGVHMFAYTLRYHHQLKCVPDSEKTNFYLQVIKVILFADCS